MVLFTDQLGPASDLYVTNIQLGSVLISWLAPFSLDITNSDLDIWYTVIINTPLVGDNLTHTEHYNITKTFFNVTIPDGSSEGMYEIEIIPFNDLGRAIHSTRMSLYVMTTDNEQGHPPNNSSCDTITNVTAQLTTGKIFNNSYVKKN